MIIKMVINNEMKEYTEEEAKRILYEMGRKDEKNKTPRTRKQIFHHVFPPANRKGTKEEEAMNRVYYDGYIEGVLEQDQEMEK